MKPEQPDGPEIGLRSEVELANLRLVNRAAVKAFALGCSVKFRAGKFTRVGQDFLDEVDTDVECMVRKLRAEYRTSMHEPLEPTENLRFTTGALCDKVEVELNRAIGRIIQNKVQRQPTTGCTLGRTR